MRYSIKAHPTKYNGVQFRSRLEARWACFFDQAGLQWEYEPIDIEGWTPDFRLTIPCSHTECNGSHVLLIEVKPYERIEEFLGHRCMEFPYGFSTTKEGGIIGEIPAHASAGFGINPSVTYWEMAHGSGGGVENIHNWVMGDIDAMWKEAGNQTQYKPQSRK
jgi:hypothetical protein